MQLILLETISMEVGFENCGKTMSPSDFVIVTRTHARVPYSISILMVIHFESMRLEKMSRTRENLIEMMSPTCFEILHCFIKDFQTLF